MNDFLKMSKEDNEFYSSKYNRAKHQCDYLFNLLGGNMELYIELEDAIKYLYYGFYVPGNSTDCLYTIAKYRVEKYLREELFTKYK